MVTLYVEGGGNKTLGIELRRAFRTLVERAGVNAKGVRIKAGGSREDAYNRFKRSCSQGESAFLLVDSEGPVPERYAQGEGQSWTPWRFLNEESGDGWQPPADAEERQCHLMVQCMESWLLTSPQTVQQYFGQGFHAGALPGSPENAESVDKDRVLEGLRQATRNCRKHYDKGRDSFKLLERLEPTAVRRGSAWADRLFRMLP